MKRFISNQIQRFLSRMAVVGLGLCALQAWAQPEYTVSVTRSGPQNIYKGFCPQDLTTFVVTSSPAPDEDLYIYIFVGGPGGSYPDEAPDPNPCDAIGGVNGQYDFQVVNSPNVTQIEVVPYLYQIKIPAGHTSATCTVEAITRSSSSCSAGYLDLNVTIPAGTDYTGNEYAVLPGEGTSIAYVYPPLPSITASVAVDSIPPVIYKTGGQASISFTVTTSTAIPVPLEVNLLVGGDGTGYSTDPCYTIAGVDFTTSGLSNLPFPDGYYITIPAGQTSATFTVTAAGFDCGCDNEYQTLLVTVINGTCSTSYGLSPSGYQTYCYEYPSPQ